MPLKRKLTPIPDGNILAVQLPNALESSADETTKSTPAESKLLFEF
jgi:hypothetical protein